MKKYSDCTKCFLGKFKFIVPFTASENVTQRKLLSLLPKLHFLMSTLRENMKLWLRGQPGWCPWVGRSRREQQGPLQGTDLACLGFLCQRGAAEQEGWPWGWGQTAARGDTAQWHWQGQWSVVAHWVHTLAWASLAATRTGTPAELALHRETREAIELKAGDSRDLVTLAGAGTVAVKSIPALQSTAGSHHCCSQLRFFTSQHRGFASILAN